MLHIWLANARRAIIDGGPRCLEEGPIVQSVGGIISRGGAAAVLSAVRLDEVRMMDFVRLADQWASWKGRQRSYARRWST